MDWKDDGYDALNCTDRFQYPLEDAPAVDGGGPVQGENGEAPPSRPESLPEAQLLCPPAVLHERVDHHVPDQVHALMRDAGLKPGKVHHAGLHMLVEGVA